MGRFFICLIWQGVFEKNYTKNKTRNSFYYFIFFIMLLCPLENSGVFMQNWVQVRPKITQNFGENPKTYARFNMIGHNGIDLRARVGTPVYAPSDGKIKVRDDGGEGYGLHVKIRSSFGGREIVLGHLNKVVKKSGGDVFMGELIGYSGNSGFSTGPHLHLGFRKLIPARGNIFGWSVRDYENSYFGYINPLPYLICFKGGISKYSL